MCGEKQSLLRVFFESAVPKECRERVQEFNARRGERFEEQLRQAQAQPQSDYGEDGDDDNDDVADAARSSSQSRSSQSRGRWDMFLPERSADAEQADEDDGNDGTADAERPSLQSRGRWDMFLPHRVSNAEAAEENDGLADADVLRPPPSPHHGPRFSVQAPRAPIEPSPTFSDDEIDTHDGGADDTDLFLPQWSFGGRDAAPDPPPSKRARPLDDRTFAGPASTGSPSASASNGTRGRP